MDTDGPFLYEYELRFICRTFCKQTEQRHSPLSKIQENLDTKRSKALVLGVILPKG